VIFEAYFPRSTFIFWAAGCLNLLTPIVGYVITSIRPLQVARALAWTYVVGSVAVMALLCKGETAVFRMFAICGVLLYAMKAVVAVSAQVQGVARLPFLRWLGFAFLWPGMQPSTFHKRSSYPLSVAPYLIRGVLMAIAGVSLVICARWIRFHPTYLGQTGSQIVAMVFLLVGISLILHFGMFNIVTACWRWARFDCRSLFRAPLLSKSLAEFWGKRWNLAFSQMAAIGVYRPLVGNIGSRRAATVAFLFSGLLHEIGISVPVMAGFGLPMVYFVIHGLLLEFERKMEASGHSISGNRKLCRVWVVFWLVAPTPLLFHAWFLREVAWPLAGVRP
jgi:hypothetical protein